MTSPPIPHAVLSEHFQQRMAGRRLRAAVFVTFRFDPSFFEQEVLPVFLDVPLSHAKEIRLVQLEDALRDIPGQVAVYYDTNGLVPEAGSARLDVRRIAIRQRGIFHAKNVFLLVESVEPDHDGYRERTLIASSLSANLTRAGWWENVECCHTEEIGQGGKTRLKDDLMRFLRDIRPRPIEEGQHRALHEIVEFLRDTESRRQRSDDGQLHPHFFCGGKSFVDFLDQTAGNMIRGAYLEVISPYFDDATDCIPLKALIDRFSPRAIRIHLPRSSSGEALCREELFEAVAALPNLSWGHLPKELTRSGTSKEAVDRCVHAKVYRFFTQHPKSEVCFVGSVNLTTPAHQVGGNTESGFLLQLNLSRRPEFWLTPETRRPQSFLVKTEDGDVATSGGTNLSLRYHWDRRFAEAYWDAQVPSGELRIEARNVEVLRLSALSPRTWIRLDNAAADRIAEMLSETSLFMVHGERETPGMLLVQEEGMSHKPSLLMKLTAADILRYWSLLTPAQRAAFLEARAPELALTQEGADLVTRAKSALENDTLFTRFAGYFHAFACLDRAIRTAFHEKNEKEATYRLFGKKYDSLDSLLGRILEEVDGRDDADRHILSLCARQLCREMAKDFPEYWAAHATDVKELEARFEQFAPVRERLLASDAAGLEDFMRWFDEWFLKKAVPMEVRTS